MPWILSDWHKEQIHVYEVLPADKYGFTWTFHVYVDGKAHYSHKHHITRRAANHAAKSFYKLVFRTHHRETK